MVGDYESLASSVHHLLAAFVTRGIDSKLKAPCRKLCAQAKAENEHGVKI